jgi:type IV pilus assembly protein PilE
MTRKNGSRGIEQGFTLIELLVVVAIIAILAAIAVPSYARYVGKTNRTAAQACMAEYANYMERYYTTNLRYDTAGAVANADPHLDCQGQVARSYAVTQATTATGYTITATPTTVQQGRDGGCGTLTLNQVGTRGATTMVGCW